MVKGEEAGLVMEVDSVRGAGVTAAGSAREAGAD